MNYLDQLQDHAHKNPTRAALISGDITLDFNQLWSLAEQWSSALLKFNLKEGSRIGICLQDNWEFALAILATNRANMTVISLDWRASNSETERLSEQFKLDAILKLPSAQPIKNKLNITIDESWHEKVSNEKEQLGPINSQIPIFIKQSSGTTGAPKGAYVLHEDFIARIERNLISFNSLKGQRYLSCLPLCFSGGFNYLLLNLTLGNTVILYPTLFSASEIINALRKYSITFTFLAPTVLRWLLQQPHEDKPLLSDMKILMTGFSPISGDEKKAFQKYISPNLYEVYATSAGGLICCLKPKDLKDYADSVGKANPAVEVQIVNDQNIEVSPGVTGRLRCRGLGVSQSYWEHGQPNTGSEGLDDGWYFSGDLAEQNLEGYYYLKGRSDNIIIRGGININPAVVETAIRSHKDVNEVAVFGRADAQLGEQVVAAVVGKNSLQKEDLFAHCRNTLAPHMVPEEIILKPSLPKTSSGKIKIMDLI
ncbi:MAG: class I adenylate-forming enzyme family protein [Pseudomonadota bacterium]|nr:class I adenylate-forming enzyme family protein [Pseudomonadota bacterium]